MDAELLKTVGQVAGIGGVALGVFLLLFRDLLKKIAAPGMTKEQWFRVVVIVMILVWSVALAGVGAWLWASHWSNQSPPPPAAQQTFQLGLNQELGKFRDVLSQPPRENRQAAGKYPDVYESRKFAKWNEPRKSSVNQIVMLTELDPMAVARALIPLLSDSDGVVVEGALLALRDILVKHPLKADDVRKLLPKFADFRPLNLRDTYISNEDFSVFKGTEIFYSADMKGAVIENTRFDGLQLTYADFRRATILNCSFKNTVLNQSRWDESRARATTFEDANMYWISAKNADFGVASSDPTTRFGLNLFYRTNLNDADLVGASMIGARLDNAKLNSTTVWGVDFTDARAGHEGDAEVSEEVLRSAGAVLPILKQPKVKYGRRP